jgi:choline monooxygenase
VPRFFVDPDITRAETLPSEFYTSASVFDEAKEKIFARSWQIVGDVDQVKVPGAVAPFTMLEGCLDEPLVLTRDLDDQFHCMSNVCTHRGNVVCEGAGTERSLRCRYHGRRFDLAGKCTFMPEFEGVIGFPGPADNLPHVPLERFGPWLFASLSPTLPFQTWLDEIPTRLAWMPFDEFLFAPERARTYTVRAHWALYIDNYLEGFHIPYIHPALNETLDYGNYDTYLLGSGNLQYGAAGEGEPCFDLPTDSPDYGQKIAAYYYWLFPNFMFNFYPWGVSLNVVRPVGPNLTKVAFLPYVWKPELLGQGAGGDLDRVEREDEAVVELVQKGLRSRLYDRGRYAPRRERGVHQFHRMIAEAMG